MILWTDLVNFALAICGLTAANLGLILSKPVSYLDRLRKKA